MMFYIRLVELKDMIMQGPLLIRAVTLMFFSIAIFFSFSFIGEQQFLYLAQSFLQGSFAFLEEPRTFSDTVFFEGKYYSPLAPFPAIVLMPFVFLFKLFSLIFYQGYLQFFLTGGIFFFCFLLARLFHYSIRDAFFLAFAFCFASIYQIVALLPWSWYFVQALTVFLLFLAFFEFFGSRRYWVIGIIFACIFMSRFTAGFGVLFFLAAALFESGLSWRTKINHLCSLIIPVCIAGVFLLSYNVARFGDPFDNGYVRTNEWILPESERYELINYGLFRIENIPTNLYYYFIKSLDPVLVPFATPTRNTYILQSPYVTVSFPGTSFFIVAPFFLYLFRARLRERFVQYALLPIGVILCFLLTYYWPGWRQVGPRYLLDLLPFAYLVLLYALRGSLSRFARGLIIVSAFFDLYLFLQVI